MTQHPAHSDAATLFRRLAAGSYDALLLAALWFITAGIFVLLYPYSGLPMESINGVTRAAPAYLRGVLFPMLMLETWLFYAWFWMHGGQTLGMRAWRIKTEQVDGQPLTLTQTLLRFVGAQLSWLLFGGGYLMCLIGPHYQTLHDRISNSRTILLPKVPKKH